MWLLKQQSEHIPLQSHPTILKHVELLHSVVSCRSLSLVPLRSVGLHPVCLSVFLSVQLSVCAFCIYLRLSGLSLALCSCFFLPHFLHPLASFAHVLSLLSIFSLLIVSPCRLSLLSLPFISYILSLPAVSHDRLTLSSLLLASPVCFTPLPLCPAELRLRCTPSLTWCL